jgi:SAM-dependent methyltransferase
MKLYDLVKFRQRLHAEYNVSKSIEELSYIKNQLVDIDRDLDPPYAEYIRRKINWYTNNIHQINQQHGTLSQFIKDLDQHIELVTYELFSGTYNEELNRAMMDHDHRIVRSSGMSDAAKDRLINRIRTYSDWHYPGMELGPRVGELTSYLVASDPLYLVDLDQRFIDATKSQFPEIYQHRLRGYVIDVVPDFSALPQAQFGFIFSWDYFNYLSLTTMATYLKELFQLLRPGGVLLFSYNDGETPTGAAYAENRAQSYVPLSRLSAMAKDIGFEIVRAESFDSGVLNWIELSKPGELKTVKVAQAMGEIHHRNA